MQYFVYILYSEILDRYYIGSTNNLDLRLIQHNRPHKGYTGAGQPWILVYSESFSSKKEALMREKDLKDKKSRKFLKNLAVLQDA